MPPSFTELALVGWKGFETSYCSSSPVPQQETYKNRSSRERFMSVTKGGTALKPLSSGGNCSGSAGSAGISITLRIFHELLPFVPSRYQSQIEEERSFNEVTTPTNPYVLFGSWAGRSSKTICCSGPRSRTCWWLRLRRSQTCNAWPYFPASNNSGLTPSST